MKNHPSKRASAAARPGSSARSPRTPAPSWQFAGRHCLAEIGHGRQAVRNRRGWRPVAVPGQLSWPAGPGRRPAPGPGAVAASPPGGRERPGPLHEEVEVALPGVADGPVDLEGDPGGQVGGVGGQGLGHRGVRRSGPAVAGQRVGGPVGGRPGELQLHPGVGQVVLDRLEAADGLAELLALLGVVGRQGDHPVGQAQQLGGRGQRRPGRPGRPAGAAAWSPRGDGGVGGGRPVDRAQVPGAVDRRGGGHSARHRPGRRGARQPAPGVLPGQQEEPGAGGPTTRRCRTVPARSVGGGGGHHQARPGGPARATRRRWPPVRPWPGPAGPGRQGLDRRPRRPPALRRPPAAGRPGRPSRPAARAGPPSPASSSTPTRSTSVRPRPPWASATSRPGAPSSDSTAQRALERPLLASGVSVGHGPQVGRRCTRRSRTWRTAARSSSCCSVKAKRTERSAPGQPEQALGHHVALDLVGPGVDRAGQGEEVAVEPGPGAGPSPSGPAARPRDRAGRGRRRGWPGRSRTRRSCCSWPRRRPRGRRPPGRPSSRCPARRPRRRCRPGPPGRR